MHMKLSIRYGTGWLTRDDESMKMIITKSITLDECITLWQNSSSSLDRPPAKAGLFAGTAPRSWLH